MSTKKPSKPKQIAAKADNDQAQHIAAAPVVPIAPLWDLPNAKQPLRLTVAEVVATLVSRWVVVDGQQTPVHLGTLGPQATKDEIKMRWGGGQFLIQARIGSALKYEHTFTIDGPPKEQNMQIFSPIIETPSGLLTAVGHDPMTAFIWAQSQNNEARVREDCNSLIEKMFQIMAVQAEQMSSTKMVGFLENQLSRASARVVELEGQVNGLTKDVHAREIDKLKLTLPVPKPLWQEFAEAAVESVPELLTRFPRVALAIDRKLSHAAGLTDEQAKGEAEPKKTSWKMRVPAPPAPPASDAPPDEGGAQ